MALKLGGNDWAPLEEVGVAVLPGIVVGIFTVGGLRRAPGGGPGMEGAPVGAITGGMGGPETYPADNKIERSMLEI